MKILGIIPARYASTRFPGKPLADINGKSMVQRVYEQALAAKCLSDVVVATDDERIFKHLEALAYNVVYTKSSHQSGTDRCAEVIHQHYKDVEVVINIQGDEPFINPLQIEELAACFTDERTDIATLIKKIDHTSELFNVNKPKVVKSEEDFALYFSRQPIPFLRNVEESEWLNHHVYFKHIGIYGYKTEVLKKVTQLAVSALEKAESLEQLRWLENGFKIKVKQTDFEAVAIDTPEDLQMLLNRNNG
ncbi:MAG TPA: 3-deoxy-manno-octulosonate cytidylyltransferase [Vicingaceae bacterium]|nr:3-deoxy-manno-octulosonate cytidylyltransferase [Vicingaceae bacterium]